MIIYCECWDTKPVNDNGQLFCEICGGYWHPKSSDEKLKILRIWDGFKCKQCGEETQRPLVHLQDHLDDMFESVHRETEEDVDFIFSNPNEQRFRGKA